MSGFWNFLRRAPVQAGIMEDRRPRMLCRATIFRAPAESVTPKDGPQYFTSKRVHAIGVISSRPVDAGEVGRGTWKEVIKQPRLLVEGVEVYRGDVVEFAESIA